MTVPRLGALIRFVVVASALTLGIGNDSGDAPLASAKAVSRARAVEGLALSSVAGGVPERAAVRNAQAAAILEARKLGLDLSIAAVGSGGGEVETAADDQAFARLAERFPQTVQAVLRRDTSRARLAKAWSAVPARLADDDTYDASAEVIPDDRSRAAACVIEFHAAGETLRPMLAMTFHVAGLDAIERKARTLRVSAADVAFLVAAHEAAHCVIGAARRAALLETAWADPAWPVPRSWIAALTDDDHDVPALAKTEESAADLLAVLWAADALGAHKARKLARLSIYATSLGARPPAHDALHDSSRAVARLLARGTLERSATRPDATRLAWTLAAADTRAAVLEAAAAARREAKPPAS